MSAPEINRPAPKRLTSAQRAKQTVNAFHTSELELKLAAEAHEECEARLRDMFSSKIGETLFLGGKIIKVRYRVDDRYEYRSHGTLAAPHLGLLRPAPMVVAEDPFSALCEAVIVRPEEWLSEGPTPELGLAFEGLQLFADQRELLAAQRKFDKIHPTIPARVEA